MLLRTLGASLLGNLLSDEGARATIRGQEAIRVGDGVIQAVDGSFKAGQGF